MKILFINHENNLGGATRSMIGIIDQLLLDSDNEVFVFVPKFNEETKQGKLTEELDKRGVTYLFERSYWWMYPKQNKQSIKSSAMDYLKLFLTNFTSFKVARFAKKHQIEIIHSNSSVTCLGAIVAQLNHSKHIWHIREFGQEDHGLEFIQNKNRALKFMKNSADAYICISQSIYEKYSSIVGVDRCRMIYNGVDLYLPIKDCRIDRNFAYNILISGRIKESKGQRQAIEALRFLRDKGYDKLHLFIAGVGEEDYVDGLNKYIEDNDLVQAVTFCGFVENMNQLRNKVDIELVCSKMEAFGRVTVEAMLNSNPVVGSNTGGTKELIEDGVTGLIYQQGDSMELASNIEMLIKDNRLRAQLIQNAYGYANENYTSIINAKKVIAVYKQVLNGVSHEFKNSKI